MEYIKGFLKGLGIELLIGIVLVVLTILTFAVSSFPKFNLFFFLLTTIGLWQFLFIYPLFRYKWTKNKRKQAFGILISSIFGLIISFTNTDYLFAKRTISIDSMDNKVISFLELPEQVQKLYIQSVKDTSITFDKFLSSDTNLKIKTYNTTIRDGYYILLTQGFKHHFIINNIHFTLQANQGYPFILDNRKFYYSKELNLNDKNLKKSNFVEVKLEKYLK